MQNVDLRLPPHVEDPEQVVLVWDVVGAADLVRRHVKREELAKHGRLDFQHPLGVIGIVKGQNIEAEPVPDRLSDPLDLRRQVVPTRFFEPVAFQVVNELLSQFPKPAVGGILLGEVDSLPPQRQPRLACATGSDDLLWRLNWGAMRRCNRWLGRISRAIERVEYALDLHSLEHTVVDEHRSILTTD